jgi:hypothetical protein
MWVVIKIYIYFGELYTNIDHIKKNAIYQQFHDIAK